ncbi:MAG TPA: OmpA family protein [Rhodanobacteraceae bacterium]|nr:OmpA family protein [Rhodanobacteraceae bacterium]
MSSKVYRTLCLAVGVTTAVAFAGCTNYVKRSDFDAAITKLQNTDQSLQQQITSLQQDMQSHFAKYDTEITAMQGRIDVNNVAHFTFNGSTLQDQDKAKLDEFAKVMKAHHSDAMVTVEGFADPAGSTAYNKRLGKERANAVRNYLVNTDGMAASQVHAVSYGEARNRQVKPGATRTAGAPNRRATLVIDFAGTADAGTAS